jgi:hypothetical protein
MIRFLALFTLILFFNAFSAHAYFKVLLCGEFLKVKTKTGAIKQVLPGDIIEATGELSASKYPAYVALFDPAGKVWEKEISKATKLTDIVSELKKTSQEPYVTSLVNFVGLHFGEKNKSHLYSSPEFRDISTKSLSHLPDRPIVRCPNPPNEIVGIEINKVERKAYSIYVHSKRHKYDSLLFSTSNLFDEFLDSQYVKPIKFSYGIRMDFTKNLYEDKGFTVIHLTKISDRREWCDKKAIQFLTETEEAEKNADMKKLSAEISGQNTLLTKYLHAMVYEDHEMYLNSTELYMEIFNTLAGQDKEFNNHLYKYLISPYLYNSDN